MAKGNTLMPFGYEVEKETAKGTLLVIGIFDDPEAEHVPELIRLGAERSFHKLVLLPQHEETLRRMKLQAELPYYKRVHGLNGWLEEHQPQLPVQIDEWEGKRQKYTPLDTLLQFAVDKYKAPHFVAMTDTYANAFATYASFDEWIRRVRLLVVTKPGFEPHPKLAARDNRWEAVYM
ncbi:hypothetical protein ACFFK0_30170 [Paenibacillus chartarius]|uniref:Uncharacterized protein n=1 Tax=Paenibacillus chartarius TaxID=747481 RepID=A0ABV6DVI4_9BACL